MDNGCCGLSAGEQELSKTRFQLLSVTNGQQKQQTAEEYTHCDATITSLRAYTTSTVCASCAHYSISRRRQFPQDRQTL